MDKQTRITQLQAEIARLEALRGTAEEPPALDAQVGQLRRTLAWHEARLGPSHYNVGSASLYERTGRSKRTVKRFNPALDYPAFSL